MVDMKLARNFCLLIGCFKLIDFEITVLEFKCQVTELKVHVLGLDFLGF